MQHWIQIIGLIVLVGSLTGCLVDTPHPIMHPVQASVTTPAGFLMTLTSPLSCLTIESEATFDLTITNPDTDPRLLDAGTLDMLIAATPAPPAPPMEYRWSESTDYPGDIRRLFGPGEVRHYAWRWRVAPVARLEVFARVTLAEQQAAMQPQSLWTRISVDIEQSAWEVGGNAGTLGVSCADVVRVTEQTATSRSIGE
jgi:hypothetical protein